MELLCELIVRYPLGKCSSYGPIVTGGKCTEWLMKGISLTKRLCYFPRPLGDEDLQKVQEVFTCTLSWK